MTRCARPGTRCSRTALRSPAARLRRRHLPEPEMLGWIGHVLLDALDRGHARPAPAEPQEPFDRRGVAGHQRLHRAVDPVAYPARYAQGLRLFQHPDAEAHALYPAADD